MGPDWAKGDKDEAEGRGRRRGRREQCICLKRKKVGFIRLLKRNSYQGEKSICKKKSQEERGQKGGRKKQGGREDKNY